jgi:hypothetical protein
MSEYFGQSIKKQFPSFRMVIYVVSIGKISPTPMKTNFPSHLRKMAAIISVGVLSRNINMKVGIFFFLSSPPSCLL